MPARDEVHAALARVSHHVLGELAREKGAEAQGNGLSNASVALPETIPTLCTSSGPASQTNGSCPNAAAQRSRSSLNGTPSAERPTADRPSLELGEGLGLLETSSAPISRVVTHLGVRIEGHLAPGTSSPFWPVVGE